MTETVRSALIDALRRAGSFNQADSAPPVALLWPDPEGVWEPLMPSLRAELPVLTLGSRDEAALSGPAIWIRCVLGGELLPPPSTGQPWLVWLPGIARDELRAVDGAPAHLRALAEVQYRADWWTQRDRSAWTPPGWLGSQNGLGLDVARDQATRGALQLALTGLFDVPVETVRRRGRIDAGYVMGLVSRDMVRTLLRWLHDPAQTQAALPAPEWEIFLAQCRKEFEVDLRRDGQLSVAERLAVAQPPWDRVWERYAEAPGIYANIPGLLHRAKSQLVVDPVHWPQDNDDAERVLGQELLGLRERQPEEARARIAELEVEHGGRRETVWGVLGQSPLADALRHLSDLASLTQVLPHADSVHGYETWFAEEGHRTDAAAVAALASVRSADLVAAGAAVRVIYYAWLDATARRYQDAVGADGYTPTLGLEAEAGDCVVFVDGLRYDVGQAVLRALIERGVAASIHHRLAPLPSVTTTGKAALMPFAAGITAGAEFEVLHAGRALRIKDGLRESGVAVLAPNEVDAAGPTAWTEASDIDRTGHNLGLALAERLGGQVSDIASRVQDLLGAGWQRVVVVTDHGWLLMPGALNRQDLPIANCAVRKPRGARLKEGAGDGGYPSVPYVYDPSVRIVSPRGIAAFEAGLVYDHGGVSPQECVIPVIIATAGAAASGAGRIAGVSWAGFRCRVAVEGAPAGASVDLRRSAGEAGSTVASKVKPVEGDDEGTVLVTDDALQGLDVFAVLLSQAGDILFQVSTRVGG